MTADPKRQNAYEAACAEAHRLRRLLDPQVRLTTEQRTNTATMTAAVDASNRNRATINAAIRQADKLIATLRDLDRLDEYGALYTGVLCVGQAADEVTDAVDKLEQRLLAIVDQAAAAPTTPPAPPAPASEVRP